MLAIIHVQGKHIAKFSIAWCEIMIFFSNEIHIFFGLLGFKVCKKTHPQR
jgi:hypothetical protein